MLMASHLPEFWDALFELVTPDVIRKNQELKINFFQAYGMDAPLCIVVPERFVPVVKWFECQNLGWLSSWPIPPKQLVNTIILRGFL